MIKFSLFVTRASHLPTVLSGLALRTLSFTVVNERIAFGRWRINFDYMSEESAKLVMEMSRNMGLDVEEIK